MKRLLRNVNKSVSHLVDIRIKKKKPTAKKVSFLETDLVIDNTCIGSADTASLCQWCRDRRFGMLSISLPLLQSLFTDQIYSLDIYRLQVNNSYPDWHKALTRPTNPYLPYSFLVSLLLFLSWLLLLLRLLFCCNQLMEGWRNRRTFTHFLFYTNNYGKIKKYLISYSFFFHKMS